MGEHEEHYASDGAWWLDPAFTQKSQNKRLRTVAKGAALVALLAVVAILPVVVGSILAGGA